MTDVFALSHVTDLDGVGGFLQIVLFARATGRRATYPYPGSETDRTERDELSAV